MKKRILLLTLNILLVGFIMSFSGAFASSASLSISGGGTYNVGDTVRVTFTLSGKDLGNATVDIKYDSGVLQYTGGSGGTLPPSASGLIKANLGDGNARSSFTVTLNFKALKSGTSTVSVNPFDISDYNFNAVSCSAQSTSVTVKNVSASASGNANLASLKVSAGRLSPAFSPNTTSYTVNVGNEVTVCTVSASTADSGAKWSITGSSGLSVGKNTRKITVTAANGATKVYTLNIYRAEEDSGDGEDEDNEDNKNERPDELKVTVGDKEYIVVENFGDKDVPKGFAMGVVKLGEYEVPGFTDKNLKYTLVLLKDGETGDEKWFFYNEEKGEFLTTVELTPEDIIAYEEAAEKAGREADDSEEKGIKTETILLAVLGVTGAALLGVVIALQIKLIKSKR